MASTQEVKAHLESLRNSVNSAINTISDYQVFGEKFKSADAAVERAKITTIPSERIHASDCSICSSWGG